MHMHSTTAAPPSWVQAQSSAEGQERATAILGSLLTTNGVTASLARPNRTRFRANLDQMLRALTAARLHVPLAS